VVTWNWELYNDAECEKQHFLHAVQELPSRPVLLSLQGHSLPIFKPEDGAPHAYRHKQNQHYWLAGKRPYFPPRWFTSEAYVAPADEEPFRTPRLAGAEKWSRPADAVLEGPLRRGGAAVVHFALAPAVAAAGWDAAAHGWWASRGMAVNFFWHPGPVAHLLIASQVATWLLDALAAPADGFSEPLPPRAPFQGQCGRPVAFCAPALKPSRGPPLASLVRSGVSSEGWADLEDAVESDYRSFWAGNSPGYADGLDEKRALVGDKASGPLVLAVRVPVAGLAVVLCEHRCGTGGCEKHRGFLSFGPKASFKATVTGNSGEGERTLTFRERLRAESYARPRRGPRYTAEEQVTYGFKPRPFVSDVTLAIDGVAARPDAFAALQDERDRICHDCRSFKDACAVVATNLTAGEHTVSVAVSPRTFRDENMHVAISAVLVA